MTKSKIKDLINKGYKITVCLQPNEKHNKTILKTWLKNNNTNVIYPIYYNHCLEFLNTEQKRLIQLYKEVSLYQYRDKVELNIKSKKDIVSRETLEKIVILKSINKIEYLELI